MLPALPLVAACEGPEAAPALPLAGDPNLPVILLTGFEPFGPGRPPNSSWEAIKTLDGRQLGGFRLVSRKLEVVWGAPLNRLQAWINELHPVAIFSFGQGNGFTIETRASNDRGAAPDNNQQSPQDLLIAQDGPQHLNATINHEQLSQPLISAGYPLRVSRFAGQYLCEECLYTLEYLKAKQKLEANVMFCHLPALGGRVAGNAVTVEYVQKFVLDLLAAWHALYQGAPPASPPKDEPQTAEVRQFVEGYFRSWSTQRMEAYADCFHSDAIIQFVDANGRVRNQAKDPFCAEQRKVQATSPAVEVPTSIDIRFEGKLARAVAGWKLTQGRRVETGYDHFTLIKLGGRWRILNLTFYGTQ